MLSFRVFTVAANKKAHAKYQSTRASFALGGSKTATGYSTRHVSCHTYWHHHLLLILGRWFGGRVDNEQSIICFVDFVQTDVDESRWVLTGRTALNIAPANLRPRLLLAVATDFLGLLILRQPFKSANGPLPFMTTWLFKPHANYSTLVSHHPMNGACMVRSPLIVVEVRTRLIVVENHHYLLSTKADRWRSQLKLTTSPLLSSRKQHRMTSCRNRAKGLCDSAMEYRRVKTRLLPAVSNPWTPHVYWI